MYLIIAGGDYFLPSNVPGSGKFCLLQLSRCSASRYFLDLLRVLRNGILGTVRKIPFFWSYKITTQSLSSEVIRAILDFEL